MLMVDCKHEQHLSQHIQFSSNTEHIIISDNEVIQRRTAEKVIISIQWRTLGVISEAAGSLGNNNSGRSLRKRHDSKKIWAEEEWRSE